MAKYKIKVNISEDQFDDKVAELQSKLATLGIPSTDEPIVELSYPYITLEIDDTKKTDNVVTAIKEIGDFETETPTPESDPNVITTIAGVVPQSVIDHGGDELHRVEKEAAAKLETFSLSAAQNKFLDEIKSHLELLKNDNLIADYNFLAAENDDPRGPFKFYCTLPDMQLRNHRLVSIVEMSKEIPKLILALEDTEKNVYKDVAIVCNKVSQLSESVKKLFKYSGMKVIYHSYIGNHSYIYR